MPLRSRFASTGASWPNVTSVVAQIFLHFVALLRRIALRFGLLDISLSLHFIEPVLGTVHTVFNRPANLLRGSLGGLLRIVEKSNDRSFHVEYQSVASEGVASSRAITKQERFTLKSGEGRKTHARLESCIVFSTLAGVGAGHGAQKLRFLALCPHWDSNPD